MRCTAVGSRETLILQTLQFRTRQITRHSAPHGRSKVEFQFRNPARNAICGEAGKARKNCIILISPPLKSNLRGSFFSVPNVLYSAA
jgi:hypothetical protein